MTPTIRAEFSIVWAAMMALVLAWPARGHAALVLSASVQAKTMVRVITYDRNFNKRFRKGITIGGKPGVVVNRAASRKEGTKFSAQLLRIAKLVD